MLLLVLQRDGRSLSSTQNLRVGGLESAARGRLEPFLFLDSTPTHTMGDSVGISCVAMVGGQSGVTDNKDNKVRSLEVTKGFVFKSSSFLNRQMQWQCG